MHSHAALCRTRNYKDYEEAEHCERDVVAVDGALDGVTFPPPNWSKNKRGLPTIIIDVSGTQGRHLRLTGVKETR